jgi:NhaP-type Na+/H+ or K+/H+ antiporter
LLIGLQLPSILDALPAGAVTDAAMAGASIVLAVIALRFAWMLTVAPLLSRLLAGRVPPLPRRHLAVLSWSGMRGALSLAGALSIPLTAANHPFPARDQAIFFVYCVVLGTLIVPSFTLKALVRRLGLGESEELREQELTARIRITHAALARLEQIAEQQKLPDDLLSRLRGVYELRLSRLESGRRDERREQQQAGDGPGLGELRQELVSAQRRALREIRAERTAAAQVMGRIQHDIDLEETRLRPVS